MTKQLITALILLIIIQGCIHEHAEDMPIAEHEHGGTSITQYTDKTEIFMEYPGLVISNDAEFLIHLTDLKNFKAVTEGKLAIEFSNGDGKTDKYEMTAPTRDGIYIPVVNFSEPGNYQMIMNLSGSQVNDRIIVDNVIVHSGHGELPHEAAESGSGITFLKEQQWKIDFANETIKKRKMQMSVIAMGEIEAKPGLFSKVVSPIEGFVLSKNNTNLKTIGTYVKKDDILLNISPSADATANLQRIKSDYLLAKADYERVEKLFESNAASVKQFDEAKFDFESKQASYNSLVDQIVVTDNGYAVVAPIDGYVENLNFHLGDQLTSGQELYTIINPDRLVLKINVPSTNFESASNSTDASFKPEGIDTEYRISLLNGKKLSVSARLNSKNRTIPVYFEFDNPQNQLKVGMYAEVYLKVGRSGDYLSIPESAIINEDGLHTAYVQTEGELFEKRILTTGFIDNGFIQVIDGLEPGERVVSAGAYQVRLAALTPESQIGHGHVH